MQKWETLVMMKGIHKIHPGRSFLCGLLLAVLAGCATGGADIRLLDEARITPPGETTAQVTTSSLKDIQLRRIAEKLGVVLHIHF